ncbi:MAG: hypothetical protein R3F30_05240 [Planctomycetota bacterium]
MDDPASKDFPPMRLLPPPCKSSFQRALLCGLLAGGRLRLRFRDEDPAGYLARAGDLSVLLRALGVLGVTVDRALPLEGDGRTGFVEVVGRGWTADEAVFDLGGNATALRMLTGIAACLGGRYRFDGAEGLERRSLGFLRPLLQQHGVDFAFAGTLDHVPFRLDSRGALELFDDDLLLACDLRDGTQAASGLLLGLAATGSRARLALEPIRGGHLPGYLALTARVLAGFGVHVVTGPAGRGRLLAGTDGAALRSPGRLDVPADPSSAAWILVLAAGLGRRVTIEGLDLATPHPDLALTTDLEALGQSFVRDGTDLVLEPAPLPPGDRVVGDLDDRPDCFPALAAILSAVPGRHVLGEAPKLRGKESDRIAVLARGLAALGFEVEERRGSLILHGREPGRWAPPQGVVLDPDGDHRMYMAFACLARIHGVEVEVADPACVAKSWPGFPRMLAAFSA